MTASAANRMLTGTERAASNAAEARWQTGGMSAILLSLLFGAPWLVPALLLWSRARKVDLVPPSAAESARERLWQR